MKKTLTLLISLALPVLLCGQDIGPLPLEGPLYEGNHQDLVFSSRPSFGRLRDIFILAGRSLPSSVGPITREEIFLYLSTLPLALSPVEEKLRNDLLNDLTPKPWVTEKKFLFSLRQTLYPELYVGNADTGNEWVWDYPNRPPAYNALFRFWGSDNLAFAFDVPVSQDPFAVLEKNGPVTSSLITSLGEWNKYFPFEGWFSFGGEVWSFQVGRGELTYGPGRTGNLLLSDAGDFADFASLSFFWQGFKFHTLIINQDYYSYAGDLSFHPSGWMNASEGAQEVSRFHTFHRFEFRINPQLVLSLTEAGAVETKGFDFRFLNPFYVYHNWFLSQNSDSNAALDLEWTPMRGFTVYGAFLADYVTTSYKQAVFSDTMPLALGWQAGFETLITQGTSLLRVNFEAVWIDPFTYTDRNFNWVLWRRNLSDYAEIRGRAVMEQPLGYVLGPDSALLHLSVSWENPGFLEAGMQNRFIRKGMNNLRTRNPSRPDSLDPALPPPPGEEPGLTVSSNLWSKLSLSLLGLPEAWFIRLEAANVLTWDLSPVFQDWRVQGALSLFIEW